MNDKKRLRVGIWGIGSHVRRNVIPAFEASLHVELVALHTRTETVLGELARATGATPYRDVDQMLSADDVDVVYIAAPTGIHASASMRVIDAGKHVWCEKPMTASYEETQRIIRSAGERGVVAMESDMFLHHPQFAELQRLMRTEAVGAAVSMTARFGFPHLSPSDFRYSKDLGGGALLDAGFYPVAAAVALFGSELQLIGATIVDDRDLEVDIGGTALGVAGGRSAVLDWGFGRSYRNEIEIWCEHGVIIVDRAFTKPPDLATQIVVRPQDGTERTESVAPANQFAMMLGDFAAVTRGDVPFDPEPTLARARLLAAITALGCP